MKSKFIVSTALCLLSLVSCKNRDFNSSSAKATAPGSLLFHCKTKNGGSFKIFQGAGDELNIGGVLRKITSASVESVGQDTTVFRFQPADNGAGDAFTVTIGADLNPDHVSHGETDLGCVANALFADTVGMNDFVESMSSKDTSINLFSCTTQQGKEFSVRHMAGPTLNINGALRSASHVVIKKSDDSTAVVFSFSPVASGDGFSLVIGADNNPDSIFQIETRSFCKGKAKSDLDAIQAFAKQFQ